MLTLREPITRGAQKKPDLIEGITCASTVTQRFLPDATAHLTWRCAGECDDAERHRARWWHLGAGQAMAFLLSLEGDPASDSHPRAEVFSALGRQFWYTAADLPGTRSTQAGRGMIFPSRQVHDASELTGPSAASVLVMPHASHQPPAPEPPQKRAGSSDAAHRHGSIRDHTLFHVVRHIQRRLNHRNLAGTPAQGASITSTTIRPWPCAIHPATRAPPAGCTTQHRAPEYLGCESRSSDGSPPN